jgi:hypothetical protein
MPDSLTKPSAKCKLFTMTSLDDYVSQTEAAEILGVNDATVGRWSDERLAPEHRRLTVIRRFGTTKIFRRADVEALRDELAEQAAS